MPTYNGKESAAWRKMIAPLVAALVALCGCAGTYFKAHSEVNDRADSVAERLTKLESRVDADDFRIGKVERDAEILKAGISNIQSDVSYIRGKLEAADLVHGPRGR